MRKERSTAGTMRERIQFCAGCGREMPYELKQSYVTRRIRKKEYVFEIAEAVCAGCGENVGVPGLLDYNAAGVERQYRELEPLFSLSDKMLLVLSYLFQIAEEITPLALQKMLYFIQGIHILLFGGEVFQEDCQAWAHGPVYKEVYEIFRDFQYNPIEDRRLTKFGNRVNELSEQERKVIGLVAESFGAYSGKTLERVTHKEAPWKEARAGCPADWRSSEVITKASIGNYFRAAAQQYDFSSVEGIRKYIDSRLRMDRS